MKFYCMDIQLSNQSVFVFDLDDTLYEEMEYLKSAYQAISHYLYPLTGKCVYEKMLDTYVQGGNAFLYILDTYPAATTLEQLLKIYREHTPTITLRTDSHVLLTQLKTLNVSMCLITDGRSSTQRNKLQALKIAEFFAAVVISEEIGSEKPDRRNFQLIRYKYPNADVYYFADNLKKDFCVPLQWGWTTFCLLDRGNNIHKQDLTNIDPDIYLLHSFDEITLLS